MRCQAIRPAGWHRLLASLLVFSALAEERAWNKVPTSIWTCPEVRRGQFPELIRLVFAGKWGCALHGGSVSSLSPGVLLSGSHLQASHSMVPPSAMEDAHFSKLFTEFCCEPGTMICTFTYTISFHALQSVRQLSWSILYNNEQTEIQMVRKWTHSG